LHTIEAQPVFDQAIKGQWWSRAEQHRHEKTLPKKAAMHKRWV